jgi:hypothetical protein
MSHRRSLSRGPSAFRRGTPRFPSSGRSFLIVTEGLKTEPNYFIALRNRLRLVVADVEILHPGGTDPLTLTSAAIRLRDERKRQAKKGFAIAYDEVWVVFDMERPHDKRRVLAVRAMAMKEAAGIKFALSDPCFEFWLLLHEKYTTAQFTDCDAVIKQLRRHWHGYQKGQPPTPDFLEKLPTAVLHAERCRKHHKSCGGDGNPSTKVDILARQLNSATRSYLQFKLG